jgi:hypothetical protein
MLDVDLLDRARSQIGSPTPLSPGVSAPMVEVAQLRENRDSGEVGGRPRPDFTRGGPWFDPRYAHQERPW